MARNYSIFKFLRTKQNRTSVDKLMSVAAIAHPLMAVPQIVQLYSTKQAAGLSIFMWIAWFVLGLVFAAYGIAHRLTPYLYMQLLWLIVDVVMIVGILLYR